MFWQLYKYSLKRLLRNVALSFWTCIFPLFLGTVFYFSFGRAYENVDVFKAISVALVETEESNETFCTVIDGLSGEDGLLVPTFMTEEEAEESLGNGDIGGIFYVKETPELIVLRKGITASILNIILEQYLQSEETIKNVASKDISKVPEVISKMQEEVSHITVTNENAGNMNIYLQYFYALFAMSALYASFLGLAVVEQLQPTISSLGQRRCVAPTNKMTVIMVEFLSALTLEMMVSGVTYFYFTQILRLDFGTKVPQIFLLLLVGNAFGVAFGIFVESLPIRSSGVKFGIAIVLNMVMSFFSGLMINNIRNVIENTIPILNKINPAALIVDSFFVLNIYDNYDRFTSNVLILTAYTIVLCLAAFFITRRNRYASL